MSPVASSEKTSVDPFPWRSATSGAESLARAGGTLSLNEFPWLIQMSTSLPTS